MATSSSTLDVQTPISRRFAPPLFLLAITLISYIPALYSAGYIWDDPDYVTHNLLLRSPQGLLDIWTKPSLLPQYYPLVHTSYWLEYHLVGLSPHLYHLDNILLHAASAILFYYLLRQLKIPGALLAACIFATHPFMVESVAWITERKNTLSLVFYLSSAITYLHFSEFEVGCSTLNFRRFPSHFRWYAASLFLFFCALLSKTVTATLPAALLLILWHQRRLTRRTILPLTPFFLLAIPLSLYTSYLEQHHVGATGTEFNFTPATRLLIASRAPLFYLGKLLYPHPLSFIYPKWNIDPHVFLQWLPLLICTLITIALILLAIYRTRSPLIAWFLFLGTLFPALGFFNVYPMRYSYVADHFAYHASLAPIALFAATLPLIPRRRFSAFSTQHLAFLLLLPLSILTFLRCHAYQSPLTLWTDTAAKNPDSWMVHVNLGHAYVTDNNLDAAEQQYNRALELSPNQPEAVINVAGMLSKRGQYDAAISQFQHALSIHPDYPPALFGIGSALLSQDHPAEARTWLQRAITVEPDYAQAQYTLGRCEEQLNDPESARRAYLAAIAADPEDADSLYNLGTLYVRYHHPAEAIPYLQRALSVRPNRADYHANLAGAYLELGQVQPALVEYATAARLNPSLAPGIQNFLAKHNLTLRQ